MRELVIDTETTGLDPSGGHRIVEIGAMELFNHLPTGRTFHQYLNPDRPMPEEAYGIHGLGDDFLQDKPRFAEIAGAFLDFIGDDSSLVIHNASFDMKFLNAELSGVSRAHIDQARVIDTLALARQKYPGAPASLDALCRRFSVDTSAREKHGALVDCALLAAVYLELVGGREPDFGLALDKVNHRDCGVPASEAATAMRRPHPLKSRITEQEALAHRTFVASMGEGALWLRHD